MSTIDLQPATKQEQSSSKSCFSCSDKKRCSDFDEECAFIKNNLACFFGKDMKEGNTVYVTGVADGYCPLIHHSN